MTSAKGEGSSRHKGKEIVADDPPSKAMGKEAPFSESKHSEKEEGSRNHNSECPPFIDPWYDTHTHIPMVPGDYFPLPRGRVWLSICRYDMEVS